eukprot:1276501-Rhodomonas_salina.2
MLICVCNRTSWARNRGLRGCGARGSVSRTGSGSATARPRARSCLRCAVSARAVRANACGLRTSWFQNDLSCAVACCVRHSMSAAV